MCWRLRLSSREEVRAAAALRRVRIPDIRNTKLQRLKDLSLVAPKRIFFRAYSAQILFFLAADLPSSFVGPSRVTLLGY